jgi:potassium-transporting ATPase KdpC subunit
MKSQAIIALKFLLVMTVLTGLIYPLVMTGIAQVSYPSKANGSLIIKDGKIVGSELLGQKFDTTIYFWSRPSAVNYNPVPSGASNYGPTSDTLRKLVNARRELFAKANSITDILLVPKEMIFASGSGLDPQISPESALLQVNRIAKARNFTEIQQQELLSEIQSISLKPQFYVLGEPRINVLQLNLIVDNIQEDHNFKLGEK